MTDLIWVGNTLCPRWLVLMSITAAVVIVSGGLAVGIAAISRRFQ